MTCIDTFGDYVRRRLDLWGQEFSLSRNYDVLGHQSKSILQVLIDHRGEMPGRVQGFKPLDVDRDALQIEWLVSDIARDQARIACALRAHYCGSGRRKVERYETAILLIANIEGRSRQLPKVRQYLALVEEGRLMVRGALIGMARAA